MNLVQSWPLCFLKLPPLPACIPSPSSLMDLGSDTAKHCMVSYFCGWGSCSCDSSWFSLWGLTSILQLNVWLFLLGPSLDHGTPFTTEDAGGRSEGELQRWSEDLIGAKIWTAKQDDCDERARRAYDAASERHNESKTERMKLEKVCKRESGCWVEISHNEQLEHRALCHPSTAMYHSQASICVSSKIS